LVLNQSNKIFKNRTYDGIFLAFVVLFFTLGLECHRPGVAEAADRAPPLITLTRKKKKKKKKLTNIHMG